MTRSCSRGLLPSPTRWRTLENSRRNTPASRHSRRDPDGAPLRPAGPRFHPEREGQCCTAHVAAVTQPCTQWVDYLRGLGGLLHYATHAATDSRDAISLARPTCSVRERTAA